MRNPRDFAKPLAIGAPDPLLEIPFKPSRMIHFFDPSNAKMAAKVPEIAKKCDVMLGNLEDAIQADNKVAARMGLVKIGREVDFGTCQLWTRVNSLEQAASHARRRVHAGLLWRRSTSSIASSTADRRLLGSA